MKKTQQQMDNYILQSNQEFHDNFVQTHYNQPKKQPFKGWIWGSVVAVVVICVVCLAVFLPLCSNDGFGAKRYFVENEKVIDSSMEELSQYLKYNKIVIDVNIYVVYVQKFYDSITNDDLYFLLNINSKDGLQTARIFCYINKDYTNRRSIAIEVTSTAKLNNKELLNSHSFTKDEYGVYTHKVFAQSQQKDFYVYFEFNQFALEEQTTFLTFASHLIQTK